MEVYGLTGGIGSGKSTVAEMLEDYGIPVVSADELSRMVVAPGSRGLADVVEAFGSEVLDDRGELDRKKMGQIVFTTPERRRQLEAILHPRIRERYEQVLDAIEKAGHQVMVYEVPLLFEKKLDQQDEMKAVILVTATTDTRMARVKSRDTLTTDEVLARMRAQMPEAEKRARADYIVHNDGDLDDLRREVEHLISRFLKLAPRSDEQAIEIDPDLEPVLEIEEAEIDESEIDTLSPEEVAEEPTQKLPLGPSSIAGELEISMTPIASPPQAPPELEVELEPATAVPAPAPSDATPTIPTPVHVAPPPAAGPPSAPAVAPPPNLPPPPSVAPPAVTPPAPAVAAPPPPPASSSSPAASGTRPRIGTAPQVAIPFVREDVAPDDGETPT